MHCYGLQAWCQHDYLWLPAAAGRSACSACMHMLKLMWHSFLCLLPFLGVSAAEYCLEERDNGDIQVRRSKRVEALQVGTVTPSLGHHQDSTVTRSALLLRKVSAHPTTPSSVWHIHHSQQSRTSFSRMLRRLMHHMPCCQSPEQRSVGIRIDNSTCGLLS